MCNEIIEVAEEKRLVALKQYSILDTLPETPYDSIAWLVSYICKTPIALISFIDGERQWIKAKIGTDVSCIPRNVSFCNYTIEDDELLEVRDMSKDARFASLPAVSGEPHLKFYAGVPLVNDEGYRLGSICAIDYKTGKLDEHQKEALKILAKEVVTNLEARKNNDVLTALLEKAQKFHNLFNNSSELHCITDANGKIAFVNDSVEELLGYRADEVLGKTIWDFCVDGERERVMPAVYDAIASGQKRFQLETYVVTKNGDRKWFDWADVIMDGYWLVNGRDITKRKVTEKRLNSLLMAVEKSPAGVVIRDAENHIEWMNEALESLIGYKLEELAGREFGSLLIGPQTDRKVLEYATQMLSEKKPYEVELVLYKKDKTPVWLFLSNNPLFNSDGSLERQITIALDITLKKESEFQLLKAKQDAIDLSKSKEVFLSVMSHEMRTPLNAVIGMTRILKDEEPLERQEENLKILEFSADNLLTLINDVLDFTKIETGNLQLERVPVHLESLVSKTIESLRFKSNENNIDIIHEIDPALPVEILGDPTRLYQIFMNLLGNALKFTHSGYVKLNAERVGGNPEAGAVSIRFSIEDTGIGIAADKLQSIFDAYSQAEINTSRKYGGTGLGLSITKKLVELHNSGINVESTVGKGTVFSFVIDFQVNSNQKAETVVELEVPINARILVVDDNAINRLLAKKVLEKWSIIVEFAENGQEAVDKVIANPYDLVLMDIHMPVMDGEEAVRAIRSLPDEKYKALPILALTGSAPKEEENRFINAGMNDFVLKPFDAKLLYKKIKGFLG